jgi:hypothetical protein
MDNFYECYITKSDIFVPIIQSDIDYQLYPARYCSSNPIPHEECIKVKVVYDNWKCIDSKNVILIYDYVLENGFLFFDNEKAFYTDVKYLYVWNQNDVKFIKDPFFNKSYLYRLIKDGSKYNYYIPKYTLQESICFKRFVNLEFPCMIFTKDAIEKLFIIHKKPTCFYELQQLSLTGGTDMAIFKAYVAETDDYFKVINVTVNDTLTQDTKSAIKFSSAQAYEVINGYLQDDKIVLIPRSLNVPLTEDVLVIKDSTDQDILAKNKQAIQKAMRIEVSDMLALSSFTYHIDFYKFCVLNNYFNSKGFFITEENKEDMYLNVVAYSKEQNDTVIVDKLVELIELTEKLNRVYKLNDVLNLCINDVELAETSDEVNNVYTEFKEKIKLKN